MIKYQNISNKLIFETKTIPQNCGEILEQIDIDNYNNNCRYFLELKCPEDNKFISKQIEFDGQIGKIVLPNIVTENTGKVFVQLIVRNGKGDIVNKSLMSEFPLYFVESSINAVKDISNEKTNDCIGYMIETLNDINNLSSDLRNKVISGEFNGAKGEKGDIGKQGPKGDTGEKGPKGDAGGVVVKVANTEVQYLDFIDDPQTQLNKKANKEDLTRNSILPSENIIFNIFPQIENWDSTYFEYKAPANGTIIVVFSTINNVQINNFLASLIMYNNELLSSEIISASPTSFSNEYVLSVTIKKGSTARLFIGDSSKVVKNSLSSRFIFAEEF